MKKIIFTMTLLLSLATIAQEEKKYTLYSATGVSITNSSEYL